MKDLSERWEGLVERVVVGGSRASSEVATSSIVTLERETIPKFRLILRIITILGSCKDEVASVTPTPSLLTQEAADVFSSLPSSSKRDYDSV